MTGKDKDPWGQKDNKQPPDLIEFFKKMFNKKSSSPKFNFNPKFLYIIPVGLIGAWALSGFFVVQTQDKAVITRFRAYQETLGPGLHWIPRFIDKSHLVNVQKNYIIPISAPQMLTIDEQKAKDISQPAVGAKKQSTKQPNDKTAKQNKKKSTDNLNLGIVVANVNVNYRIKDPYKYLFSTTHPEEILKNATDSALRQVVSSKDVNKVISQSRSELHRDLISLLNKTMKKYDTGLEVRDVVIGKATVPDPVKDAYLAVVDARSTKTSFINQAKKYESEKMKLVQGISQCLSNRALSYQYRIENKARGDVARFVALEKEYKKNPNVTRERIYLEHMQDVLSHTTNIVMGNENNNLVYLPLNQLTKKIEMSQVQPENKSSDSEQAIVGDASTDNAETDLEYCQRSMSDKLFSPDENTHASAGSSKSNNVAQTNDSSTQGGVAYGS